MKKFQAFSLIEVLLALALLSIIVISLIPIIGQVDMASKKFEKKENSYQEARNLMECNLAKGNCPPGRYVDVRISTYSENFDLVEIYEKENSEVVLYSLRQK